MSSARTVAAGILASKVFGLVRERAVAHFFGLGPAADAIRTAFRLPNLLQNLLGEGTLSASFVPVYSKLLDSDREQGRRVAGAVFALLVAIAGALSLVGILLAPVMVTIFAPGFHGDERFALTVQLVRILFPMTGVLVVSAWALGILNSHRRFLLPYTAPVIWNLSMIATLAWLGRRLVGADLALALGWAAFLGGVLQLAVQLPLVFRLEPAFRPRFDFGLEGVRVTIKNAAAAIGGRGAVQLSGYADVILASLLPTGAVATLACAQTLQLLPISLFGMSAAAAEIPEMSRETAADVVRARAEASLRRVGFLALPSAVAFLAIGQPIALLLFGSGAFTSDDAAAVALVLAGYGVGLYAAVTSRVLAAGLYSLQDAATPARFALARVATGLLLAALLLPQLGEVSIGTHTFGPWGFGLFYLDSVGFGPLALALAASLAGWLEWWLLRRALVSRLGAIASFGRDGWKTLAAALVAGGTARLFATAEPFAWRSANIGGAIVAFAALFAALTLMLGVPAAWAMLPGTRRR